MKDPLQKEKTPYEVLGVDESADRKEVLSAFKKSLASGENTGEATRARSELSKKQTRGLVDIFLYNDAYIDELKASCSDNGFDLVRNRAEVARKWAEIEKRSFPHYAATHSLALLWYWWLIHKDQEEWCKYSKTPLEEPDGLTDCPPVNALWSNVISRWVLLLNSEDFWDSWIETRGNSGAIYEKNDISTLRSGVDRYFDSLFDRLAEKYTQQGEKKMAVSYNKYETQFKTELKTAQGLVDERIGIKKGERVFFLCCGRLMLDQVGLLDTTLRLVNEKLESEPGSQGLARIQTLLSPHVEIRVLLDNKKYDELFEAIEALPAEEKEKDEVQSILARGYLEKGEDLFSVGKYEEAMDCWKEGLDIGELRSEIQDVVVTKCKEKAAALKEGDPVGARNLLEGAVKIVDDQSLKDILSIIYMERGIKRVVDAMEKLKEDDDTEKAAKQIEYGVKDLEKSVELDPSNQRAKEQFGQAKDVLQSLKDVGPINTAISHMNDEEWEKAFGELKSILKEDPKNEKARELFAICANNMAVSGGDMGKAIKTLEDALEVVDAEPLKKNLSQAYEVRGVQRINNCQEMATKEASVYFSGSMFKDGLSDLEKAVRADSSNTDAKEKLEVAKEVGAQVAAYLLQKGERNVANEIIDAMGGISTLERVVTGKKTPVYKATSGSKSKVEFLKHWYVRWPVAMALSYLGFYLVRISPWLWFAAVPIFLIAVGLVFND